MRLYLVRHGRTDANARGELLGRRDPDLDEVGEQQAAALASALREMIGPTSAVVISSPLQRTMSTAAQIGRRFWVTPRVDERWIELDYGEFEGSPLAKIPTPTWSEWRNDPNFAPPGGERLGDVRARVAEAIGSLVAAAADAPLDYATVIVVSHVAPIKAAVAEVLGTSDSISWRMHLDQASITTVDWRPAGAVLLGFNDVAHIAGS